MDITVDSPVAQYRIGVECKSRKGLNRYNLGKLFANEQFERINTYLYLSGKRGFLAIKARGRPKNKVVFIKWDELRNLYAHGQPSFRLFDPAELPRPVKKDEIAARELVKNSDGIYNFNEVLL